MSSIKDISDFTPRTEDAFILDTNVLIKIFYPAMGAKNSSSYIALYQQLCDKCSSILISSIQLSEFVNRCIRFQFDLYRDEHPEVKDFKNDYRDTPDYRESMQAILEIISEILKSFKRVDDKFTDMSIEQLTQYGFSFDFNDALIAELCRKYNTYLITDDKDYANFLKGLNIVTNNRQLMMFQKKHC